MRQQMEMHRKVEPCASCHKIMDPIGFSMENFDAIGHWRTPTTEARSMPPACWWTAAKLDGVGDLRAALSALLAAVCAGHHREAADLRLGRGTEYYDMPLVRSIVREAEEQLSVFIPDQGWCRATSFR